MGHIRTTDDGAAVIHVKGKGGKEPSVPIEAELLSVIEAFLTSRAVRFPGAAQRKADVAAPALSRCPRDPPEAMAQPRGRQSPTTTRELPAPRSATARGP